MYVLYDNVIFQFSCGIIQFCVSFLILTTQVYGRRHYNILKDLIMKHKLTDQLTLQSCDLTSTKSLCVLRLKLYNLI